MFEGNDSVLNIESVPSNTSYKSFKTWELPRGVAKGGGGQGGGGDRPPIAKKTIL